MIQRGSLRWDLGLATHAAMQLDLLLEPPAFAPMAVRPASLALAAAPGWQLAAAAPADRLAICAIALGEPYSWIDVPI